MIFIGIILLLLGLLYFYSPNLIIKSCELAKKYIFNERIIILYGKKIGLVLVLVGLIFFSLSIRKNFSKNKLYSAYKKFYSYDFKSAEKICLEMLSEQPKDVDVLYLLGKIYFVTQRYIPARNIFLKIKSLKPKKEKIVDKYIEVIEKKLVIKNEHRF